MTSNSTSFFNHPSLKDDFLLRAFFSEADQMRDCVFYTINIIERKTLYINQVCESILGYSRQEFVNGGPEFIFSVTDEDSIPAIIQHQRDLMMKFKSPDFSPYEVHIPRFNCVMKNPIKGRVNLVCQAVFLTFTKQADPEFGLVFLSEHDESSVKICRDMLHQVKVRHNEIYDHPPFDHSHDRPIPIVHITNNRIDLKITQREQEVLMHLSNGDCTHEIAKQLNISINTIETHRRHLLEKFEAKNVAELIKKASKVFWLE